MRLSKNFFFTLREDSKEEDSKSGNLLVKSGYIKKASVGAYMFMPLGLKVMKNIENIVREEMIEAGSSEVLMPALVHEDIYRASGRAEVFGSSIFRLNDRYDKPYILGPTHEELFTMTAKMAVKSYKDLPFNIFQIQNKFRDEPRPRYGLIRVREFLMKDAYSFDSDSDSLDNSYKIMFDAYKKIFDRCKVDYKIVTSDTGAMGGLLSEEFQAITEIGEDVLVLCDECGYASNLEVAEVVTEVNDAEILKGQYSEIETIGTSTIEKLSKFTNVDKHELVKCMIVKADDELVACLISGDKELNDTKLQKLIGASEITLPEKEEIEANTNAVIGYAGPIGLNIRIVVDNEVMQKRNFICGANKKDYHYQNANITDFDFEVSGDIINIEDGGRCPNCEGKVHFARGIEIGNTFKLGTKYAKALGLEYADQENKLHDVWMGCYGIGIGRIMAALVEQMSDDKGLVWPMEIAPYKVSIIRISDKDEKQIEVAENLYKAFTKAGIDVILDDRKARAGVKFNDADLIGVPIRITVGKKVNENQIELKLRKDDSTTLVDIDSVVEEVIEILK